MDDRVDQGESAAASLDVAAEAAAAAPRVSIRIPAAGHDHAPWVLRLACLTAAAGAHGGLLAAAILLGVALPGSEGREPESVALEGVVSLATEANPGAVSQAAGPDAEPTPDARPAALAEPLNLPNAEVPPPSDQSAVAELVPPVGEAPAAPSIAPEDAKTAETETLAAAPLEATRPDPPLAAVAPPLITAREAESREPAPPLATAAAKEPREVRPRAREEVPRKADRRRSVRDDRLAARTPHRSETDAQSGAGRSAPSRSGGGRRGAATTTAGAAASPGAARSYGALVRARIAQNRARQGAGIGRAVVSFAISPSGALRFARVGRSSGTAALDSAALASVKRAAPFPTPPAGMSGAQLSFTIPFDFR